MKSQLLPIGEIKRNPKNPRIIKDWKFDNLVQSIKDFPEMLEIRPIVVNEDKVVIGGNMRLKAAQEAGLKKIPIIIASHLTPSQQDEFMIKDNNNYGDWDWDKLANEWDSDMLKMDYHIDIPQAIRKMDDMLLQMDEVEVEEEQRTRPSRMDDDYTVFDMIVRVSTKKTIVEVLNKIKNEQQLNSMEEALLELIKKYTNA
jgi:hypothetical protein